MEPKVGSFILLVGPRSLNSSMLAAIARLPAAHRPASGAPVPAVLAQAGQAGECLPVRVLDGGNRFNAYTVARQAGGRPEVPAPVPLAEVLECIMVSRAFTCYQVLSLLESTPATRSPFIVLDLLNTFYDESVQAGERKRLLRGCIAHLHRLEQAAGGAVSVHPPAVPSQVALELLGMLQAATADTYFVQPAPPVPEPMRLL